MREKKMLSRRAAQVWWLGTTTLLVAAGATLPCRHVEALLKQSRAAFCSGIPAALGCARGLPPRLISAPRRASRATTTTMAQSSGRSAVRGHSARQEAGWSSQVVAPSQGNASGGALKAASMSVLLHDEPVRESAGQGGACVVTPQKDLGKRGRLTKHLCAYPRPHQHCTTCWASSWRESLVLSHVEQAIPTHFFSRVFASCLSIFDGRLCYVLFPFLSPRTLTTPFANMKDRVWWPPAVYQPRGSVAHQALHPSKSCRERGAKRGSGSEVQSGRNDGEVGEHQRRLPRNDLR